LGIGSNSKGDSVGDIDVDDVNVEGNNTNIKSLD